MTIRPRYRSFTAKEKLRIIDEAENIENHAAGTKYDVSKVVFVTGTKKQNATYGEE